MEQIITQAEYQHQIDRANDAFNKMQELEKDLRMALEKIDRYERIIDQLLEGL